jgi:two-component system nitrate/nitrite response regulator NarL
MTNDASPKTPGKKKANNGSKAMVMIASSDAGLRERWVAGLQNHFTVQQVWDGEMERSMADSKPDVLLLDRDLPGMDGVERLSALHRLCPSTRIVFFTGRQDEREAIDVLKAGARGYCIKEIESSHLRKAVKVIRDGEVWAGRRVICQLLAELTSCTEKEREDGPAQAEVYLRYLTPRERQISLLVSEGSCNKEIANRLNISERTVKAHLTVVFHKLQISDRLRLGLFVAGQNHGNHTPPPQRNDVRLKSN